MDEEISLRELIDMLLHGKKVIIGIIIVFILTSAIYSSYILDPVYEAKTILSVNQSAQRNTHADGVEGLVNNIAEMPQVNAESYATLAKTSAVLRGTMERLGIDTETVSVSAFAGKINITNIKGTDLLEITVKDKDPKLAATISNTLAEVFVEFISDTSKNRIDKTITFLESQVGDEQAKVDENVEKMKKFIIQSPSVAELEKQLETSLNLISILQEKAVEFRVKARGMEASVKVAEEELEILPDKIQLKKNLYDDPSLYQVIGEAKDDRSSNISGLELITEEINPAFAELSKELGLNKSKLAMFKEQKAAVEQEINLLTGQIEKIQVELADKKTRYNQLETELESSIQNSELFKKKYTETKIAQSVKAGEAAIVVVSQAYEPILPIGPRKLLNTAVAALAGLMLGVFAVVFKNYMANTKSIQNSCDGYD